MNAPPTAEASLLHISDVEFRGETIYFIVLDRFFDGNPSNKGDNSELNDPSRQDWAKYWGGDLQGVLCKLDYLEALGVTAVWLTPLFEQIETLAGERAPIHGYWTQDFKRINARWVNDPSEVRLFTRNDTVFDELIKELHRRGMKLVLDVVCNHSSPASENGKGKLYDDGRLIADFENDVDHWYHHYGPMLNWEDEWQVQNTELEGLATFNENNILYRRHIKNAMKQWIDKGVDALRIDTVKHMPQWFWQEFAGDMQSHRPDVFMFGEWFASHPDNEKSVDFANRSGMAILDFGLCHAIRDCLAVKKPEGFRIVQDIYDKDERYRNATELVTFFENHDMPRLQSLGADNDDLGLALVLIMTGRGIPCFYYGSEQYLHNDTDGGDDPYNRPWMESWDTTNPMCRILANLTRERRKNPAIKWGSQNVLHLSEDVFCFSRRYRDSWCLVALNRGGPVTLEDLRVDAPHGDHLCLVSGSPVTVTDGRIPQLALGPKEARVLARTGMPVQGKVVIRVQINGVSTEPGQYLVVIGDCPELGGWDLRAAFRLEYINRTTWFGELVFDPSIGKPIAYKFAILNEAKETAPIRENRVVRRRSIPTAGEAKWRDVWEE